MADRILDALGPVLTRWAMGGSAVAAAPADWRAAVGADAREAELRLLALSGQFLGAMTLAEPAGEARPKSDIPALAKPTIPDGLRPRVRRLLENREPAVRRYLLDFVDGRGWTLHPGDWMPKPTEDVPEIYAPWQDWSASTRSSAPATTDVLSSESWDALGPARRHAGFVALRRARPEQARVLLAEKIGAETPENRFRLLDALAVGLSDDDRPLLESLAGDRATRVKARAASLLARLGHGDDGGEDAAELAAFFPAQTKGLLRRTRTIAPQELKTPAQRSRRTSLMETVSFDAFAKALSLTSDGLIAAWPWSGDRVADRQFAEMVARSASDAVIRVMVDAVTTGATIDPYVLYPLLPRVTPEQRWQAALRLMQAKNATFTMVLSVAGGDGRMEDAMNAPASADLLTALKVVDPKLADQTSELLALGLIASQKAATAALKDLATAGLIASDPRLDMLRLNAALDMRGTR